MPPNLRIQLTVYQASQRSPFLLCGLCCLVKWSAGPARS
jgi:hypothetical protein